MMHITNKLAGTLIAACLLCSGTATAQSLKITVPDEETGTPTAAESVDGVPVGNPALTDRMAEQIRTLIRIALLTGDASAFESALTDLTSEAPELAVSIASFTTTAISDQGSTSDSQVSEAVAPDVMQSIMVAAAVGPAIASPAKFQEIVAATTAIVNEASAPAGATAGTATADGVTVEQPVLADLDQSVIIEQITQRVEETLIELFNDDSITAGELAQLFTASGEFAEAPTTTSASPTG